MGKGHRPAQTSQDLELEAWMDIMPERLTLIGEKDACSPPGRHTRVNSRLLEGVCTQRVNGGCLGAVLG